MDQYKKFFVTVIILSSIFFGYMSVCAQPLGFMSSQQPQKPKQEILCSANGRFVFGQISDSSKDQFMLDTLTGRLWRIAESGKLGVYLRSIPYLKEKGDCSPLPPEISDSGSGEAEKK